MAVENTKTRIATLAHPLKRGDQEMTQITLRKPGAGELRGIKLLDVMQMDVTAHAAIVPRISDITKDEFWQLEAEDLAEVMGSVVGFFVKADIPTT